jgi:hypothetical protein
MPEHSNRFTREEFWQVARFYQDHLPGWRICRDGTLVRETPPVLQGVTLDRLSDGVYRPTGYVRVLVAPRDSWSFELAQDLNIKLRTIDRREHERLRDQVVAAMRAEFVPAMDRPLVAEEVLDLYEERAYPIVMEAYSLAALNAYLGHSGRAIGWCARFGELLAEKSATQQARLAQQCQFITQLESWLRAGTAREELEEVLERERRKWKLA